MGVVVDTNRSLKMWASTSSFEDAKEDQYIELKSSFQTLNDTGLVSKLSLTPAVARK